MFPRSKNNQNDCKCKRTLRITLCAIYLDIILKVE